MSQDYENSDTRPYIVVGTTKKTARFVKPDSPTGMELVLEQNEKLRELFAVLRTRNNIGPKNG